jgi:predicted DNA binding CopG/RHH family protein
LIFSEYIIEINDYVYLVPYVENWNEKYEEEREIAKKTAKNTIKKITKKKSLNLRIFENDIPSIKAIALEKGLPYQTFLSSIIHQVATKQIKI